HHNAIVAYDLTIKQVRLVITFLIILATIIGIILALRTDIVVLLLGILSFGAGILYSFGPVPISRTPLGEAFSGLFMGGLIFFITVYIQAYHLDIVVFSYIEGNLILNFSIKELIPIMIASFPMIAGIANIMLANNLCDLPEDIENKRYTLPYYIGEERGIKLFALLYYLSYVAIIIGVILKALPLICLLVLLTFPFLYKGIKRFKEVQKKESTFVIAVQNFTLFSISYAFTLVIGLLIF
ncbi:MAG: UbiA family prenyltransferase, partial [Peptostreptococcales bacterium]